MITIKNSLRIGIAFFLISSCYENTEPKAILTQSNSQELGNIDYEEDISENTTTNKLKPQKIQEFLRNSYLKSNDLESINPNQRTFKYAEFDLNNDSENEIFVHLNSSYFCGSGGCTILLLSHDLKLITEFTVSNPPILVDNQIENGWKSIYIQSANEWRKLQFQNHTYPLNPSMAPVIEKESISKFAEIDFDNKYSDNYNF